MIVIMRPGRFLAFIVVLLAVLALLGWWAWGGSTIRKSGELTVASGQSARSVWQEAAQAGFTKRIWPWRYYSWRMHASNQLKAGKYQVERGETVAQVINRLAQGDVIPDSFSVTYPEGFTLEQIAARTAASGISTAELFTKAARVENFSDTFPWLKDVSPIRSLEGYLFPDTYQLAKDDQPVDVIKRMLANFDNKVTPDLRQEAQASGRSLDQIIIMASIIEREAVHDEDMAKVSGVLWKRVDHGMGLDADATIRYAVDNWDKPLTVQELDTDSPYNTRKYKGLPPGPISNPGIRAIIAAVRPDQNDFYYYLTAPDGTTVFAKTLDEHNRNKAQYLK